MSAKSKVALSEKTKTSRRMFFIGAGAAVGAVAVASQTPAGKAVIQEMGANINDKEEDKTITAHMRKYYQSTLL